MHLLESARFFDRQSFDNYSFTSGRWVKKAFTGQLKLGDTFVSIWNRPTRKRMLYCAPGNTPAAVVRVPTTGEVFMLGTGQGDSNFETHYRTVYGLHKTRGSASHYRKTPVEVLGVKGWAANALVQTTFADIELRSVNENQDVEQINYGHFFMFLPGNSTVQRHDTVTLSGVTYYVLEVYPDSGLIAARVTSKPDERVNFVYKSVGTQTYNTATQAVTIPTTDYNVTGVVDPLKAEDVPNRDVAKNSIKIMVIASFISFTPKLGDKVTYDSKTYTVDSVERDAGLEEWSLTAHL